MPGHSKKLIPLVVILLIAAWGGLSCFYTVQPDERGVIIRLGKYLDTHSPGLHFKMPFGIDKLYIVKTKVYIEEFGFRAESLQGSRTVYSRRDYTHESLMLTGDLNVAEVEWVVHYRVRNPFKYLFKIKQPRNTIRDVSESVLRRVVGDQLVSDVLTTGRAAIALSASELMQEILNSYDSGIEIVDVKLQDVNPPDVVKAAFNEVNEAKQEQEKLINQAEKAYNEIIPEARGKAEETIARAHGYATAKINRAEGDAEKFDEVLKAYKQAPEITKKRMYLETMEGLFKRFKKLTIVDAKVKGLLPVFGRGSESLTSSK